MCCFQRLNVVLSWFFGDVLFSLFFPSHLVLEGKKGKTSFYYCLKIYQKQILYESVLAEAMTAAPGGFQSWFIFTGFFLRMFLYCSENKFFPTA